MARSRIASEKSTVDAMIHIFCKGHHSKKGGLCEDCSALREYAFARLDRCRFAEEKPTCANCDIHCYKPEMRERIRQVMRYAGPRMLGRHPMMAIRHVIDGRRSPPPRDGQ
jgi:hypothetical protein